MILPSELETIALLELAEGLGRTVPGMEGFRDWWVSTLPKRDRDIIHAHHNAKLLAAAALAKLWDEFQARRHETE